MSDGSWVSLLNIFNPWANSQKSSSPNSSPQLSSVIIKDNVRAALTELGVYEKMGPSNFVRLAGASGALAVILGAYGAHGMKDKPREDKIIFETGNRYHLLHSVALLASPFGNRPQLTGILLTTGMVIFCGSCYYTGLTGRTNVRWVTPYGGIILILAWASLIL